MEVPLRSCEMHLLHRYYDFDLCRARKLIEKVINSRFVSRRRGRADLTGIVAWLQIRPGGLIVVDNVLWHGKVADSEVQDKKTEALRQFNAFVAKDPRVLTVMLPVGDGMTLCQRLG